MPNSLNDAPLVAQFVEQLIDAERAERAERYSAAEVRLCDDGRLAVGKDQYMLSETAAAELAKMTGIPTTFFRELDADLRAVVFNRRFAKRMASDATLDIVWKNSSIAHVRRATRFHVVPRSEIVTTILEQAPADAVSNGIRIIIYALNGHVDLAFVTQALTAEPKPGDIVCGGVHLTIEDNGAIQVGPAMFRLQCSNGAMSRICWKGRHRIRRGDGKDSRRRNLATISQFSAESWRSWHGLVESLTTLANKPLDNIGAIIARLRGRPFLISEAAAKLVHKELEQLIALGRAPTHYDLWNAITSVGTHGNVLPQYAHRLRLGAGALARGRIGVCAQCRQFVLSES